MKNLGVILLLLTICLTFIVTYPCFSVTETDLAAIRELFLTLERGFEERDIETYMSVFSDEEYEYSSDVTTPDDPSDDIHLLGAESERRSAIRVFGTYKNLDLEMTEPEIIMNGGSAKVQSDFTVVFVIFQKPHIPSVYYAGGTHIFSLQKFSGEWKITRWRQHEMTPEALEAKMKAKQQDKGTDELIRDLGSDHLRVWTVAISDLRKAREIAITPLIKALRSEDEKVRIRAASVLCGTRDEDAIRELMKVLEDKKDDMDVRVAVAGALSECDGEMIDGALLKATKRSKPRLRAAASLALSRRLRKQMDNLYWIAVTGLQYEDETIRKAAVESMGIMMSVSGATLMEQRFRDKNESEDVRLAAWEALEKLRSASVLQLFRDVLKDKNETEQIRIHAARSLAKAKNNEALDLLIELAEDNKEVFGVRKEAIAALGVLGNSKATKPLIGILNSSDAGLRRETVTALEQLRDRSALRPLVIVLMNKDEDIYVRRLAGRGIVKIDQDIAFGPLVQIMNDKTETAPARRMAAEKLASFRDDRSSMQFVEILKNKQQPWWLRQIAASHLGTGEPTLPCIEALKTAADDADERISTAAQDALKKIDAKLSASS